MSRTRRTRARVMRDTYADRHLHRLAKAIRKWGWDGGFARAFPGSYTPAEVVTERPTQPDPSEDYRQEQP